jgi:hypothetical protein
MAEMPAWSSLILTAVLAFTWLALANPASQVMHFWSIRMEATNCPAFSG